MSYGLGVAITKTSMKQSKHSNFSCVNSLTNKSGGGGGASSSSKNFDVAVVGRGLCGAAAARHLAKAGVRVALVGPLEQAARSKGVFGAHHDEGRITRKTDPDDVWALLAVRSIDRYDEIKRESGGVQFYEEVGHLAVAPRDSDTVRERVGNARALDVQCERMQSESTAFKENFPYLDIPPQYDGVYERAESGFVSARELVQAQALAAQAHGASLVEEEVVGVHRDQEGGGFVVQTPSHSLRSQKILVAVGASSNRGNLLPGGPNGEQVRLALSTRTAQTVHFVLNSHDEHRLRNMPSIIYKDDHCWAYLLPPIKYPDGSVRLKLGGALMRGAQATSEHLEPGKRELVTHDDIVAWYKSGGEATAAEEMAALLNQLIPGLQPLGQINDSCATTHTPTGRPFVGAIGSDGLFVCTGGNGLAAKSSDEIGRLAALCVLEGWPQGEVALRREDFLPIVLDK